MSLQLDMVPTMNLDLDERRICALMKEGKLWRDSIRTVIP